MPATVVSDGPAGSILAVSAAGVLLLKSVVAAEVALRIIDDSHSGALSS